MKDYISIAEFQKMFSISRATVYRMRDRGEINFVHLGRAVRIARTDVDGIRSVVGGCGNS